MPRLVIDARKARDAGIGTYIRQLVPRVLQRLAPLPCAVWLAPGDDSLPDLPGHCERVRVAERPLGLAEQWTLRRLTAPGDLLWATSLAHPLASRVPLVATVHDVAQLALPPALVGGWSARLGARAYLQDLRLRARGLLFISQFSRQAFERLVGPVRQPTAVTPLAVDPAWHAARGAGSRPQAQPYFIAVGSVRPHKNLGRLVQAFAAVAGQLPHDLVIAGLQDGLRTADASLAAQAAGLGGRVRLLGRVDDAALHHWVAHADALVFPSLYEGFGLPPLEAMAAGCPVLCSTAAALPEVCGEAVRYFDPLDTTDLQRALLAHVAQSPAQRAACVQAGLAHVQRFDWDRTAQATAALLQTRLQELRT